MTESASGWDKNDELLGDQWTTLEQDVELHGPWGSNALTTEGIDRINGLRALLSQHDRGARTVAQHNAGQPDDCYTDPQIFGDEGEGGPPQTVARTICGYVKGAVPPDAGDPAEALGIAIPAGGNILIGGLGSDKIRGRGADDVIDGDKWLNVRLREPRTTRRCRPCSQTASRSCRVSSCRIRTRRTRRSRESHQPGQHQHHP